VWIPPAAMIVVRGWVLFLHRRNRAISGVGGDSADA